MDRGSNRRWAVLIALNVLALCVLGLWRSTAAAPERGANEPFANAVEQRAEMIAQLKEIGGLLKEQNALLKSGELTVLVSSSEP